MVFGCLAHKSSRIEFRLRRPNPVETGIRIFAPKKKLLRTLGSRGPPNLVSGLLSTTEVPTPINPPLILGNGQPAQPSPRTHCDPDLFTFTNNDPHLLYSAPNCPFRVSTFTHEVPAPDIRRSWHVTCPLIKFATSEGGNEGIGR